MELARCTAPSWAVGWRKEQEGQAGVLFCWGGAQGALSTIFPPPIRQEVLKQQETGQKPREYYT